MTQTIGQRADDIATFYSRSEHQIVVECYKQGANDQRYIDIERAVSWLETALNGDNIEGCKDSNKLIEELEQAMMK